MHDVFPSFPVAPTPGSVYTAHWKIHIQPPFSGLHGAAAVT